MHSHKQLLVVLGVVERDGRFLMLRRVDEIPMWHHKWEFPGGKIRVNETPLDALHREVFEETGLRIRTPELMGIFTHHWHLPDHVQQTFLISYRAQAEAGDVALQSKENDAHQWVTLEELFNVSDHLDGNREVISELYVPHRANHGSGRE